KAASDVRVEFVSVTEKLMDELAQCYNVLPQLDINNTIDHRPEEIGKRRVGKEGRIWQRAQNFRCKREWRLVSALTSSGRGPRAISCAFVCLRTSTLALPKNGKPKAIADLFG